MGDTNASPDIFLRDQPATTDRVSVDSAGAETDNVSLGPAITRDGRLVASSSFGTNLITTNTNGVSMSSSATGRSAPRPTATEGVADAADNRPAAANADQADSDGDALGDACDAERPIAEQLTGLIAFHRDVVTEPGTTELRDAFAAVNAGGVRPGCSGSARLPPRLGR
jgi:hypothetical protein